MDKQTCKEVLERLQAELKTKINKSQLHFYDNVNLVKVEQEYRNEKYKRKQRLYDETSYIELRTAIILRKAGVPLELIDALLNKCNMGAKTDILYILKERLRFIDLAKELLTKGE